MQNRTGSPEDPAKPTGRRAKKAVESKKGEPAGNRGHKAPIGEASLSEKRVLPLEMVDNSISPCERISS